MIAAAGGRPGAAASTGFVFSLLHTNCMRVSRCVCVCVSVTRAERRHFKAPPSPPPLVHDWALLSSIRFILLKHPSSNTHT